MGLTDPKKTQALAIGLINVVLPLALYWAVDVNLTSLAWFLLALAGLGLVLAALALGCGPVARGAGNMQLVLCSVLVCLLSIEIVGRLYPAVFPHQIRVFIKRPDDQRERQAMIEYLDRSPWMKFKPDVEVRLPGFRERIDRFAYSWRTDRLGYKNDPRIFSGPIKAVALGDSFTEAMGCTVEQSWEAFLGNKGLPTYSMGVHGYAPSQMAATYRLYGQEFSPEYVFVGYTETIFQREKLFLDLTAEQREEMRKGGLGAMQQLRLLLGQQEVRLVSASPLVATVMFFMSQKDPLFVKRLSGVSFSNAEVRKDVFLRYFNEAKYIDYNIPVIPKVGNSPEWVKTTESLLEIKRLAQEKGARPVVIYFPSRYTAYHEKIFNRPIPPEKDFGRIENQALEAFCRQNGIAFVDTTPAVKAYVASLPVTAPVEELPYFEFDMHMSPVGQRIVADVVAGALPGF